MQQGMSYRKPVPIYVPSPPASPTLLAAQLPHSFENAPSIPIQQEDTISISNTAANATSPPAQVPALDKKVPSLLVKSPEGEQIPIDNSNYTPLTAPSDSPPSLGRHMKPKLHQQYRPPTPPLPSHTRKPRTPDIPPDIFPVAETSSSSIFTDNRDSASSYPELRRKPSTVAPSFTTYHTQNREDIYIPWTFGTPYVLAQEG
ncbi:hypothetical protein C0995_002863 [Termitomyces sp. Mi166|nr:hypothetical protein C0995_002863 [Termitomyces sp. Mi166\